MPALADALPGGPLRPPRPRPLAGAARPVHVAELGRRRARRCSTDLEVRRVALRRAVAGRHGRHVARRARARAGRPAGAALHLGARSARRQAGCDRAATVRAGGMAAIADAVVARWFTPAFARRDPHVVAAHRAMLPATPAGGLRRLLRGDRRHGPARRPGRGSRAPTLVIAGADDPATPPEHARADRRAHPRRPARGGRRGRAPGQRRAAGAVTGCCWTTSTRRDERRMDDDERHEAGHGGAPGRSWATRTSTGPSPAPTPFTGRSRTSSPATPGARSGPGRAWTGAPAAASPSRCSPPCTTRRSWRCTCAPRCATG